MFINPQRFSKDTLFFVEEVDYEAYIKAYMPVTNKLSQTNNYVLTLILFSSKKVTTHTRKKKNQYTHMNLSW